MGITCFIKGNMHKNLNESCIFCKIVSKTIDSAIFWQNDEFVAVLDINPNTRGMALVLTKQHYDSYVFSMPDAVYLRFMTAAKSAAGILERGLPVKRVAMVMEGMGINHAHIKLYPLHGLAEQFVEMWGTERVFFERYTGYLTTQLGPQAQPEELKRLSEHLKKCL